MRTIRQYFFDIVNALDNYHSFQQLRISFFLLQVSPLNDIEKILDCELRPTVADDNDASKLGSNQIFVKQYLVKWKGLSYLHCTW